MVVNNQAFLDFTLDIFEEPDLTDSVIVVVNMADGPNHIGYGRRQPIGPTRNNTTQRGPKLTPVRREIRDRKGIVRRSR